MIYYVGMRGMSNTPFIRMGGGHRVLDACMWRGGGLRTVVGTMCGMSYVQLVVDGNGGRIVENSTRSGSRVVWYM